MEIYLKLIIDLLIQKEDCKVSGLTDSDNTLKWIPIIQCWNDGGNMGISEDYEWVAEGESGLYTLSSTRSFLFVKVLLERSLINVFKEVNDSFLKYGINEEPARLFPYFEITKAVFEDNSEYWTELAFNWYDELPVEKKNELKTSLEKIKIANWASQKLRHKAMKELAKLNRE